LEQACSTYVLGISCNAARTPAFLAGALHCFVEETVITGKSQYPVERTLLTTGLVAAMMESGWRNGKRLETPHLQIAYTAPKRDPFARGPEPTPEKPA